MFDDTFFCRPRGIEAQSAICVVSALLIAAVSAHAETEIRSLTGIIEGHRVGGVTVDLIGNIYVPDFGDYAWKITPEGERREFASGFYGSSGNAIDNEGNLLPRRTVIRQIIL